MRIIIAVILAYIYVFNIHFRMKYYGGGYPSDEIAASLLKLMMFCVLYMGGVLYISEWKKINSGSLVLSLFEYLVFPAIFISWLAKYNYVAIFNDVFLVVPAVLIYIFYLTNKGYLSDYVLRIYPITDRDRKLLFLSYPPKARIDMIVADLLFLSVVAIPLISGSVLVDL